MRRLNLPSEVLRQICDQFPVERKQRLSNTLFFVALRRARGGTNESDESAYLPSEPTGGDLHPPVFTPNKLSRILRSGTGNTSWQNEPNLWAGQASVVW